MKQLCFLRSCGVWLPITLCLMAAAKLLHAGTAGELVFWGNGAYWATNFAPELTNTVAIASGGDYGFLALQPDGNVVSRTSQGQAETPADLTNAVAISAGDAHFLALRADGRVEAWGANYYGQTNVPPNLTNVTAISAGRYHNLALQGDGKVVAWGSEFPFPLNSPTNVPSDLPKIVSVAAGGDHS